MLEFIKEYWFLITFGIGLLGGAYRAVSTLNTTLLSIKHQLEVSNRQHRIDVELSVEDRRRLWEEVNKHDVRLDDLDRVVNEAVIDIGYLKKSDKGS